MFTVTYHPGVQKDFRALDGQHVTLLRKAIDTKLAHAPEIYGKPLTHTLKNLRSLRVGEYRIIFTIRNAQLIVLILIIGKRDKIYQEALKRLRDN